jgi:hypothetical protein
MSNRIAFELKGGKYTAFVNGLSLVMVRNNEISNEVLIDIHPLTFPYINPKITFEELSIILEFINNNLIEEEHFKDRIEVAFNHYIKGTFKQ